MSSRGTPKDIAAAGSAGAGAANAASPDRRARSKKRERDIIDAAAEIFQRQGYADTSVQDVAEAVGILKGSLYYYISSKEDLLFRLSTEVHDDAHAIIEEVAARQDLEPLERLHLYIREHIAYNSRNLTKISVYYHDFQLLSPERRKEVLRHRKQYERFVIGLLEEARDRGDIDEAIDPKLAAFLIFGAMNWIYTWYRPRRGTSIPELGELCAQITLNGLRGARMDAVNREL